MCLVLFAWLSEQGYFKDYTDINTLKTLREKTDQDIMDELLPFGFVDRGEDLEEILDDTFTEWNMNNRRLETEFL